jgi:hypothetical protein
VPSDSSVPARPRAARPVPATLILAGLLTVVEGLGILVVTGWLFVGILREPPREAVTAWGAMGLLGAFGIGVAFAGRGVLRAARWSRAPAAVTQLLVLALGAQLAARAAVAVFVAVAVVTGVLLFMPPSTAAFVGADDEKPDGDGDGTAHGATRRSR